MSDLNHGLLQDLVTFYKNYYKEEVGALAQAYPKDKAGIDIDYPELYQFSPEVASNIESDPAGLLSHMQEALDMVDLPIEVDLTDAEVRLRNLNDEFVYAPSELRHEHAGDYIGVQGTLSRATGTVDRPEQLVFECTSGHTVTVPQVGTEIQEPGTCPKCEARPNWRIKEEAGEWTDEMKVKIETPPDESGAIDGDTLTGYVRGDLVDYGHEIGLAGRTGEDVRVYGIIRREQRDGRGQSGLQFDRYMEVHAVDFLDDTSEVAIERHREAFEELANTSDPIDLWMQSLAPELHATPEWERALELGVAYLFAAPRIDIAGGPTYRGDIHMLIVSDYGMGKSTFTEGIAEYSPKAIKKSATGLASGVGLTATAVQDDDFGDGGWILKPGILVRANGGHVILDELDKGPDELTEMNDALEGQQMVSVDKAGKDAEFQSRTGLLATGNPVDGKFDPHGIISEQIGIDASLLSRFDGIITMRDNPDAEIDTAVAKTIGEAYKEAQEVAFDDREEMDILKRPVPVEVGKAWVKYAREAIHPLVSDDQIEELREWYATEIRDINKKIGNDDSTEEPPVPVTARVVENTIRVAVAFARVNLREDVTDTDIARAKDLIQTLAGQTFGEDGYMENWRAREAGTQSQLSRRDRLKKTLQERGPMEMQELEERLEIDTEALEHDIQELKNKGVIMEPEQGRYRTV